MKKCGCFTRLNVERVWFNMAASAEHPLGEMLYSNTSRMFIMKKNDYVIYPVLFKPVTHK